MQKVEIFNYSSFPELVEKKGNDKIVLHPGKSIKVTPEKAKELMKKNNEIMIHDTNKNYKFIPENKEPLANTEREEMKEFTKPSKKKKNKDD